MSVVGPDVVVAHVTHRVAIVAVWRCGPASGPLRRSHRSGIMFIAGCITQYGLSVYAAILSVFAAVRAVVEPRVAYVEHNLIEFVEVARADSGRQLVCRYPTSVAVVIEEGAVYVVVDVEVGKVVVWCAGIPCGAPRRLCRYVYCGTYRDAVARALHHDAA